MSKENILNLPKTHLVFLIIDYRLRNKYKNTENKEVERQTI